MSGLFYDWKLRRPWKELDTNIGAHTEECRTDIDNFDTKARLTLRTEWCILV